MLTIAQLYLVRNISAYTDLCMHDASIFCDHHLRPRKCGLIFLCSCSEWYEPPYHHLPCIYVNHSLFSQTGSMAVCPYVFQKLERCGKAGG